MSFCKCFPCLRIPAEENITELDYSNGTLTHVPPDISQFERTLEELYLSSNRIADLPPEMFYCEGLRILKVNDNELETIPSAIGSLRQLQILDLGRNALTNIPDNIKSCKCITHLDLSLNNLQRLPDAITNLITLRELLLNETYLEFLPANFGRLVNLRVLELRSNNLITLPKSMSRLTELIRIDIGANEFTELPEVIGQLTKLQELWIDYNRIRRIPSNISSLRELIHFEAHSNQLTGFPNEISNWRNLEVLSLAMNDLETLPFSIGMLKRLVTLKCDSNQLKELPDSICHLERLEELVIDHNFIVRLPSTIGLLRKMKFLIADENLLRRLPNEISSCINLSVLSVRGNKLTELPHDIGHLKNLKVVNIVDNSIRSLPVSVLNLTNLSALWISDNQSQPLVPLQYTDSASKSELTCFMLPQVPGHIGVENVSEQNNIDNNGGWYQEIQIRSTSPSRRICFADETNQKLCDTVTTRLLRSPTPYPKELRQMAKFTSRNSTQGNGFHAQTTRNQYDIPTDRRHQDVPPQNQSSHLAIPETASNQSATANPAHSNHIKEAKVLHNSQLISAQTPNNSHYYPHQIQQHNSQGSSSMLPSSSPLVSSCDNLTNVQFYFTDASTDTKDNEAEQYYANRSIAGTACTDLNYHEAHQQQPHPHANNYYESLTSPYSAASKVVNNNAVSAWSQSSTPAIHHQEILPQQQQHYYYSDNYGQIVQQQHPHGYMLYPQYSQRPQEPPPYHIAKAYTKKSHQDLLTYDSIRNRNASTDFLNGMNSSRNSSPQCDSQLISSPSPLDNASNNANSLDASSIVSNNNNNDFDDDCTSSKNIISENGNGTYEADRSSQHSRLSNPNEHNFKVQQSDPMYHQLTAAERQEQLKQLQKQKTSPWLFGLHRNPTVKQVILKKDPTLGFEIKEVANRGIFVSITMPNTTAHELLRIDDKILDVDGIDFSRINHREAQQILIDSGPILNIMISRT